MLALLAGPCLAGRLAAGTVNVEAAGRLLCDGAPMAGVQVELVWPRLPWDTGVDGVMASGVTDAAGRYHVRGAGGDFWGTPTSYVRAVYDSTIGPPGLAVRVRVVDELGGARSDHGDTRAWALGVIDMGDQDFGGLDCELWKNLTRVVQDYQDNVAGDVPLPYSDLDILRWSAIYTGTPWTSLDTIHWPTNYPVFPRTVFHETAHSVRHSFDGDLGHFFWDATRFVYARSHSESDNTNEGFAFNEGWAEFWETRSKTPPWKRSFYDNPPRWTVEGDVAADLRRLVACIDDDDSAMVRVLAENPGAIHSRDEFLAFFNALYPGVCDVEGPPPASPPGSCAAGSVSQQLYDGVVGCAGRVAQPSAGALCGAGFTLCSAAQYAQALHKLQPTHDYWTSDSLGFFDHVAGQCAARHGTGAPCAGASMHACTPGGGDAEGNTCAQTNCALDPPSGEEFPVNVFLGGCGAGDSTAGAVCCPEILAVAPDPVPSPAELRAMHDRDRVTLLQAIANLQAQQPAVAAAAVVPATCTDLAVCARAIEALTHPALLQGAIDLHQVYLRHLDAGTASMQDLQAQEARGTFETWRQNLARGYLQEVLAVRRQALQNAIAALAPALATSATATAAKAVADELTAEVAALDNMGNAQVPVSPSVQPWKPEQWLRSGAARGGARP